MSDHLHVFAGPSLPLKRRDQFFDCNLTIHPPLAHADLTYYIRTLPSHSSILIIDGYYKDKPTIWHKEILFSLASDFNLYGCSSLGAIRAAECQKYGMRGIGKIFDWFCDYKLFDDSDVALLHDPIEYTSLTVPISDLYATLKNLDIEEKKIFYLLSKLREIHFEDRTWVKARDLLLSEAKNQSIFTGDEFAKILSAQLVNQKCIDAENAITLLIDKLQSDAKTAERKQNESNSFEFSNTCFFDGLINNDLPVNNSIGSLLTNRLSYLSILSIKDSKRQSEEETEAILISVASQLFDELSVNLDNDDYLAFRSHYLSALERTHTSVQDRLQMFGLSESELDEYILERYKSSIVLANQHVFRYISNPARSIFLHTALDIKSRNSTEIFKSTIDNISSMTVDPIAEVSESNHSIWSVTSLNEISNAFLGNDLSKTSPLSKGTFLNIDYLSSIQRILAYTTKETLRILLKKFS